MEFWLCGEVVLWHYVAAKQKRRSYERVHVCLYVCVTLTLRHVSLLTLEGMLMLFLVVPTAAVETASATLAQCPDGGNVWVVDTESDEYSDRHPILTATSTRYVTDFN